MRQRESSGQPPREGRSNGSATPDSPAPAESWGAEELAATLDSVEACIWALDLQGRCVFVNQAACRLLGYAREECLGQKLQCIVHGGHHDGWRCPKPGCDIQGAVESGSAASVDDDVFQRRDGTSFAVRYSIQPVVVQGRLRGAVIGFADITARKRAEESLRKSDEWLRFAQNAAGVGIFDLDLKTGEARASEGQFRLFNLDPAGRWPSHEEWLKLLHPEDRERMDREFALALSGTQPLGVEYRIVWPDGSIHWLLSLPTVFLDEAGRAVRLVGANVDITGRVRAETALNQFFSASPTPLAIWGFDGRFQRVNPSWEAMLGFTATELEGLLVFDLAHPEDRAAVAAEFQDLLISGKRTDFECRGRCKDGSYRWVLLNASVLRDAQVIYATAHDITERKTAEAALAAEVFRRRTIFEQSRDGIVIFDCGGKVRESNPSFAHMLGYRPEEMLRFHVWDWDERLTQDRILEMMREVKSLPATFETRHKRKDGSLIDVEVSSLFVECGGDVFYYAVVRDITERKRVEEALRQKEEWLAFGQAAAGVGIWDWNAGIGETRASEQQFRLYGLAPANQFPFGEDFLRLIHPDDRERLARELDVAMAGKTVYLSRFRVVWPDGSVHWLHGQGQVFRDGEGKPVRFIGANMDITERVRAQSTLDEFFNLSPTPLAICGFDGDIRRANPAALRICGLTAEELQQRPIAECFHPEDRATVAAEFELLLATGHSAGSEVRAITRDGSVRWLLLTLAALEDEKLVYLTAYDITERKRAEETARRSEEWLKFTLNAAGIGLCYRESGETAATEQQFRLYGLEPAEHWLSRECWLRSIHPEDRERVEIEQRLAGEQAKPYDMKFRVVWPDGGVHWLLCRGKIFHDDGGARKAEVTVDVTGRKRAEAALEEFFSMSRSPMAILGFDGYIKRANVALQRTSGFTAQELGERPAMEFFHPDDRPAMEVELRKLITRGGDAEFECRGRCKDGSFVWFVFCATAAPDEKLIFTVAYDITERKRMAEALERDADRLARSNAELERFAYVASHDLQEPLRMVASFTQLLAKRYSGKLDETADRYIEYAVDGAKCMQQLIVDLLAYSRLNSKDLDFRQTECQAVVQGAMSNLTMMIGESGASVDWDALPALWVDQTQFTLLFQNLLANAIKFRRNGERPRIHISAEDTGAEWVLSVQDNGIGIEPRHAERVFQIFQRLHTRAEYPGTGIGLAICQKVAERHGGKIWVESEPGVGSTFHFTIPKPGENGVGNERAEQTSRDSVG